MKLNRIFFLLAISAFSLVLGSCARRVADRTEDRWDRRENRVDRRVYTGPGDVIEDRYDRREGVRDKLRPLSY